MSITNHDPKAVSMAFLGKDIKGFAEGTFIKITPHADLLTYTVGAQGEVAKTVVANRSATVEFTLMQNSSTNAWLWGLIEAARDSSGDWPEGNVVIKDRNAPALPFLTNCSISKRPSHEWATDQTHVTWELFAEDYKEIPQTTHSAAFLSQALSAATTYASFSDFLKTIK